MILRHYSAEPLREVRSVAQYADPSWKPQGLWVSVDGNGDGWPECVAGIYDDASFACVHDIELDPAAAIYRISTDAELLEFSRRYGGELPFPRSLRRRYGRTGLPDDNAGAADIIHWISVAAEYMGIIIAPYLGGMRHSRDAGWYNPWDCASGCIWDAAAIKDIRRRGQRAPRPRAAARKGNG